MALSPAPFSFVFPLIANTQRMRIKLILTASLALFLSVSAFAQSARWQVQRLSLGTGTAVYRGDLNDDVSAKMLKPQFSLSYSKYVMPGIGYTLNLSRGTVAASDSMSSNPVIKSRNINFASQITEMSAMGFWEILPDFRHNYWRRTLHITPYVFAGLGMFSYNPYTTFDGTKVYLQPLGTEGQFIDEDKRPYKKLALVIPFGGGMSVRFMRHFGAFGEVGFRRTMTDYLDDTSTNVPTNEDALLQTGGPAAVYLADPDGDYSPGMQRGDPSTRDWYILVNVGLSYFIGR